MGDDGVIEEKSSEPGLSATILVNKDDLRAVLAVVPCWVPMGADGDNAWTPESLTAKDRLLAQLEVAP